MPSRVPVIRDLGLLHPVDVGGNDVPNDCGLKYVSSLDPVGRAYKVIYEICEATIGSIPSDDNQIGVRVVGGLYSNLVPGCDVSR